jgi:hypothetical protein
MNTIAKTSLRTLLGAAALAALTLSITPDATFAGTVKVPVAKPPVTMPSGLAAQDGSAKSTPVPCNSVASCNSIISYCAEKGGVWTEQAHNEQGQPSKGRCDLP